MLLAVFEPTIPAIQLLQTHALDRSETGIVYKCSLGGSYYVTKSHSITYQI